jgi:hypothetical protein
MQREMTGARYGSADARLECRLSRGSEVVTVSLPLRIATLFVALAAVVAVAIFIVVHYLLAGPPVEDFTTVAKAGQVDVTMQTAAQTTVTDRPTWVTYFIKNPQNGAWDHTTLFKVPANTLVNVTILGFDGCTPLRNQFFGQVTGTIGGVMYVNGKPVSTLNSWQVCSVQHTFAIPGLGLNVPVASVTSLKENQNLCTTSPCTSGPHTVVTFSFRTPSRPGTFMWQCRIPCGLAYLYGFGGPMQTLGYMTGSMEVAS